MESLNKEEKELHLFIRAFPIMEIREEPEWGLFLTQDLGECIGDHLQTRRCFRTIVNGLEDMDFI